MKKTLMILFMIITTYIVIGLKTEKVIEIPEQAIRLRILAASNSEEDQKIKMGVSMNIQEYLKIILKQVKDPTEAKNIINSNLPQINNIVYSYLQKENYLETYKVNFGLNYFPEKEYKGVLYKEGLYESLLVTLGEGNGKNWWCVLFPPLCLIESEESENIEYKSYVKEIIQKYI